MFKLDCLPAARYSRAIRVALFCARPALKGRPSKLERGRARSLKLHPPGEGGDFTRGRLPSNFAGILFCLLCSCVLRLFLYGTAAGGTALSPDRQLRRGGVYLLLPVHPSAAAFWEDFYLDVGS